MKDSPKHIVIVGHGPSLLGRREGRAIDSFDLVIRQKRCQETLRHPEIYGTRKDVVCGSWTIAPQLKDVGAGEVWVFLDSRHDAVTDEEIENMRDCRIDREVCSAWNKRYRVKRQGFLMDPRQEMKATSDCLGHTHMSAGLHTLVYACEFLKPESISLAGFDNVQSGKFDWSVTRGPNWNHYPDHNWPAEKALVEDIENHYQVNVWHL